MPTPHDSSDDALDALHLQQQTARKWGLFVLVAALIVGAIFAPHTTLLAFVALVTFGAFGLIVAWALRQIDRLFKSPRN